MSSDNQLNYGLDTDTIDIADSVIIDVATKTLGTIPGIHSLSPRFYVLPMLLVSVAYLVSM